MPSLGSGEIIVICVLVLVLFGPNRLPELARGLGKTMREVRKLTSEFQSQLSAITDVVEETKPSFRPPPRTTPASAPPPRLDQANTASLQWTPHDDVLPLDETPSAEAPYDPDQTTLPFDTPSEPTSPPPTVQRMDRPHA